MCQFELTLCSLITCISHIRFYILCLESLLCFAMPLRCTGWAPRFELRASGLACLGASSSIYGYSMSLEQAIVRLGLCMFDFGGMWTSSFGRFMPHLCLIPSIHDS